MTSSRDLSQVVESLVDSVSELVLSSITGDFTNVAQCCMNISERTNQFVSVSQETAKASTDENLQNEVAKAINGLAASIEKLVTSFTDLLSNSTPTTQQSFAAAAKEVGEAINNLVAATDSTSQQRIIIAVREAIVSSSEVQKAAYKGSQPLLGAAKVSVEKTVHLVKVASQAAENTADTKKKALLLQRVEGIRTGSPALIQAAKGLVQNPQSAEAANLLNEKAKYLTAQYSGLIEAAKVSPGFFGKVSETYEYVKKLIESAKSMETIADDLYSVAQTGTPQQVAQVSSSLAQKAKILQQQGIEAYKGESNPVKAQLIKNAVVELKAATEEMVKASNVYNENPTTENKQRLDQANARLKAAIRGVVDETQFDPSQESPGVVFTTTAAALESAALQLITSATTSPEDVVEDAKLLNSVALHYVKDAERYADTLENEEQKRRIKELAKEVEIAAHKLAVASQKVAENPNDPEAKKELQEAHAELLEKMNLVKQAIRSEGRMEDIDSRALTSKAATDQLVSAAKESASAAMQLTKEAEAMIQRMPDSGKKEQLAAAIKEVKFHSGNVVKYANLVQENPHDLNAQKNLESSQKDLGISIQKVVNLTSSAQKEEKEIEEAMRDMKISAQQSSLESEVLSNAQKVLDEIAKNFGNPNKELSPEEVISNSKQLASKATDLAKKLREMASQTSDPIYKEKLTNAAKLIRDGAIQVKILSAVRAAGGEESVNSVTMATRGIQNNIQEVMKEIRGESLRTRFKSTVKQTMAINKVVNVWKNKALKK